MQLSDFVTRKQPVKVVLTPCLTMNRLIDGLLIAAFVVCILYSMYVFDIELFAFIFDHPI